MAGNPAAVCLLDGPHPDRWLQDVARETNLGATAFVQPDGRASRLRWFAPAAELELCGHGTLAAAHALWETGRLRPDEPARFSTRGGPLAAARRDGWIELDFPAEPAWPAAPPPHLIAALGVRPLGVARNRLDYLVEAESAVAVRAVAPDFARLRTVPTRGVIVTGPAALGDHDFVSRFFAPRVGLDEDHVTGSAHCCLGPFWGGRLGKTELVGRQLSVRGGTVGVRLGGDRVRLSGRAVTVLRGELLAD